MRYNEYCKFCVWYDRRKGFCNKHDEYKEQFDTCNAFKRDDITPMLSSNPNS